jgi:hypothetical protein
MTDDDGDPTIPGKPERDVEQMRGGIDRLDEHLDDAKRKAEYTREAAGGGEEFAGEWEDTEGGPGGDDPVGAADEEGHHRDR